MRADIVVEKANESLHKGASRVSYWHVWVGEKGVSHQTQCALTQFELKGVGGADPQRNNQHDRLPSTAVVTVQPIGWVGDWHENPAPQWIVVLSGRWCIESMDGTPVEQSPGELSFGEDQAVASGPRTAVADIGRARSAMNPRC